jgi:hypothetical protein
MSPAQNWPDTSKKPPLSRRFQKIQAQQKQLTYLYMILLDCLTGQFLKDLFFTVYQKTGWLTNNYLQNPDIF